MERAGRKILLAITLLALFVSSVDAPPIRYSLEISVTGDGYVLKSPDHGEYKPGTKVRLTAISDLGWSFQKWNGDVTGTENPTSILIDGAKKVSASFAQDVYTLTMTTEGEGTITTTPLKDHYVYGEQVQVSATPAAGWSFAGWSGALTGTTNPISITMKANKAVTATFTQNPPPPTAEYTLTVTASGSGSVAKTPNTPTYASGAVVQITATPAAGWLFQGWGGGVIGTDNPQTVIMDGSKIITARFEPILYMFTVAVNPLGGGIVERDPYKDFYEYGDVVVLSQTPSAGYTFSGWSGGGVDLDGRRIITVNGDVAVTVNYAVDVGGGGGGEGSGSTISLNPVVKFDSSDLEGGSLNEGKIRLRLQNYTLPTDLEVRAGRYAVRYTPIPHQRFDHWEVTGNVNVSNTRNPYTTLIISGRGGLTAVYTPRVYNLTLNSLGEKGGSFVGNYSLGDATLELGQVVSLNAGNHTLTYNLPINYIFLGWETRGEIAVSSPAETTTKITVSGKGALTAIYTLALGKLEIEVVRSDGRPVVGARVNALSTQNHVTLFGKTDQAGRVNFTNVMMGEYYFDVAAQGFDDVTTTLLVERDAQTARASLILEETVYNVKLEIRDYSNKPVTGANVTLYDTQAGEMTFVTDANGCAYLDLTMDDYPILVTCEGYQPTSIDLEVGAYDSTALTKLQLASHAPMMPLSLIIALTAIAILIPVVLAAYMRRHMKPTVKSEHSTIEIQ